MDSTLNIKLQILDLPDPLAELERKLTVEHKNIWHHRYFLTLFMGFQLIYGL